MTKIEKWNLLCFIFGLAMLLLFTIQGIDSTWFVLYFILKGGLFFMYGDQIMDWAERSKRC